MHVWKESKERILIDSRLQRDDKVASKIIKNWYIYMYIFKTQLINTCKWKKSNKIQGNK